MLFLPISCWAPDISEIWDLLSCRFTFRFKMCWIRKSYVIHCNWGWGLKCREYRVTQLYTLAKKNSTTHSSVTGSSDDIPCNCLPQKQRSAVYICTVFVCVCAWETVCHGTHKSHIKECVEIHLPAQRMSSLRQFRCFCLCLSLFQSKQTPGININGGKVVVVVIFWIFL